MFLSFKIHIPLFHLDCQSLLIDAFVHAATQRSVNLLSSSHQIINVSVLLSCHESNISVCSDARKIILIILISFNKKSSAFSFRIVNHFHFLASMAWQAVMATR